jgi:hypothetical protein
LSQKHYKGPHPEPAQCTWCPVWFVVTKSLQRTTPWASSIYLVPCVVRCHKIITEEHALSQLNVLGALCGSLSQNHYKGTHPEPAQCTWCPVWFVVTKSLQRTTLWASSMYLVPYLFRTNFSNILSSTPRSPKRAKCVLSNITYGLLISLVRATCYSSHCPFSDHPNNIWQGVIIMKLLLM